MSTWNDQQYLKFAQERTRPAAELLARVPLSSAATVADFGCGPGNSTALLAARFGGAQVIGIDNSPEMLQRARQDFPQGHWVEADIATYRVSGPVDLLFANAVLQWLPQHDQLFPQLLQQVRPGGVLAVQMPRNFDQPSHRLMRETPAAPGGGPTWAQRSSALRAQSSVGTPAFYYDLLAPHAASVDIWQTSYQHVMTDAAAIVEWVKGTGLRPYLDALDDAERPDYLARYTAAIDGAYPPRAGGRRLFEFPRLFIVVTR